MRTWIGLCGVSRTDSALSLGRRISSNGLLLGNKKRSPRGTPSGWCAQRKGLEPLVVLQVEITMEVQGGVDQARATTVDREHGRLTPVGDVTDIE
jgi:hypothetical protein